MKQTAVEWLVEQYKKVGGISISMSKQAKQMEKQQMCDFADFVSTYTDKNKNVNGEMLHAKSKYDGAERTIDLIEEYLKNKNNEKGNENTKVN
jgi:hypothetical protein